MKAIAFFEENREPTPDKPNKIITGIVDDNAEIYINRLQQENRQLKSILTELEEWLKKITDNYNLKWEQFTINKNATEDVLKKIDVKIEMLDQVLNKIQELKEKYK